MAGVAWLVRPEWKVEIEAETWIGDGSGGGETAGGRSLKYCRIGDDLVWARAGVAHASANAGIPIIKP